MYQTIGYQILSGMNYFFKIVNFLLLLYCVLSFFARNSRIYRFLDRLIEPLRRPFMPITMFLAQRGFPFDVSIIFVFIGLSLIQSLLTQLVYMLMGIW